jgi:hypothetical protein
VATGDECVSVHPISRNGDTASAVEAARWATLDDFIAVDETGADALVGEPGNALIPESGDVMVYGDGGAGKTTLVVDLAFHLAGGDAWLGIAVQRPVRVGLIENEGPRPQFRQKLRRKAESWSGSPLDGRLLVLDEPWSSTRLDDEGGRALLAGEIAAYQLEVVVLGPVTRAGMNEAGTLQEVRDFVALIADVRVRSGLPVAFLLVHHENKGGKVSGAWEGAVDTLLHVQAQGHGSTRVCIQKARWASSHHATTLHLAWTDGEGFELADDPGGKPLKAPADEIAVWIRERGGEATPKEIREQFDIADGTLRGRREQLEPLGISYEGKGKTARYFDANPAPADPAALRGSASAGSNPSIHAESTPHPAVPQSEPLRGVETTDLQGFSEPRTPHSLQETPAALRGDLPETPRGDLDEAELERLEALCEETNGSGT